MAIVDADLVEVLEAALPLPNDDLLDLENAGLLDDLLAIFFSFVADSSFKKINYLSV